jgi:hypothetical protein
LCSLPYAAVCAVADRHWHPASLAIFFAQIMVVLPVYFVSVLLVFRKEAKELFHKWWQSRLVRATA